jgi:2-keto-3-deoxy-L-rhamnonate aldolase RhmA
LGARGDAVVEALRYKPEGRRTDGVIGNFHGYNPSGRTMALGSTQPLTQMSATNISWG